MTDRETIYEASLIFTDETAIAADALSGPSREALAIFGVTAIDAEETGFDTLRLTSEAITLEARIEDAPEVVAPAGEDELDPTFRLHVTLRQTAPLPFAHPQAGAALLAETLHCLLETTGAPFVQWSENTAVLSARSFQTAVSPIRFAGIQHPEPELEPETAEEDIDAIAHAAYPRRIRPVTQHRGENCGRVIDIHAFRRDVAAAKRMRKWARFDKSQLMGPEMVPANAEPLEDVFRTEAELSPELAAQADRETKLERRVATWTVTASVAIFSPPVGAAVTTYNLIRGENFRLSAHALTLTGAFMGLGLTDAMAATLSALPF